MVAHVRLILFLVLVVSGLSYFKNDYLALKTPVIYEVGGEKFAQTLQINYSQLLNWRTICFELSTRTGTNPETLIEGVLAMLSDYKYPAYLTSPQETIPDDLITSRVAVSKLLEASHTWQYVHIDRIDKSDLFYLDREQQQSYARSAEQTCDGSDCTAEIDSVYSHQTEWIEQLLFPDQSFKSWLPTYLQRSASTEGADHSPAQIILYQTIGANTGGTTAMHLLHRTLHDLGYHVLICNATNRYSSACSTPDDRNLIITGEWCHEVFAEYVLNPSENHPHAVVEDLDKPTQIPGFNGRGVQYYLGFHHARDSCRGSAAVTDCHYLSKSLGSKGLSAFYLGCAMADHIKSAFFDIVSTLPTTSDTSVKVFKENLILVDPDFFTDYPPHPHGLDLPLPAGYSYLFAKGFSPEQMVLLLQRAKIVLDLGMPGPERLSTECILMGCIPIISSRWTGASSVDYPGVWRVDHQNATQIAHILAHVADNYEDELSSLQNGRFFTHALSMWSKVHQTADIVFGSSYLHFVLYARNLEAEYSRTFQLLTLLYLYPLCSVDLYVVDVFWFLRHHYAFFELLQQAGYVRVDPLDPTEFFLWRKDTDQSRSFVRIKILASLHAYIDEQLRLHHHAASDVLTVEGSANIIASATTSTTTTSASADAPTAASAALVGDLVRESPLAPAWCAVVIVLAENLIFRNPGDLLAHITPLRNTKYVIMQQNAGQNSGEGPDFTNALILAPDCPVSQLAQLLSDLLTSSAANAADNHPTAIGNLLSVCILYNAPAAECVAAEDTVCGVVNTTAWQSNLLFAKSMDYACK